MKERLAAEVGAIVEAEPGPRARREALVRLLGRRLKRLSGLEGWFHRDPEGRFTMMGVAWRPGEATPVHDHGTWGVVGVAAGELTVTVFERCDDGRVPGYADVEEIAEVRLAAGSLFSLGVPGDLHRMANRRRRGALSLHVYGREILSCNVFEPEHKRVEAVSAEAASWR